MKSGKATGGRTATTRRIGARRSRISWPAWRTARRRRRSPRRKAPRRPGETATIDSGSRSVPITMQDREQGFEAKFAHDEEVRFLVRARRDKLFAHWAAEELRLSEAETEALVKAVVAIPDGPGHEQALLAHIAERLHGRPAGSEQSLSTALARCRQQAHQQLELPADRSDTL